MHSYILYFFITFGGSIDQSPSPQIFANKESCDYTSQLIVSDLRNKLSKEYSFQTYCVPQDIKVTK